MNKALQKARVAAKLTRAELEAEARLGRGSVYDIEEGRARMPAYDSAVRILRVLEARGADPKLLMKIFPVGDVVTR